MKLVKLATILLAPFFLAALLGAAEAKVSAAADNVTVVANGVASPVKAGDVIPVGATVKVSKGQAATITLPDGTVAVLEAGSELTVTASTEKDGVTATSVKLSGGTASFSAKLAKGSSLTIATTSGMISGNKGTVSVTATPSLTTVTSADGSWTVQSQAGAVAKLAEGQSALVKATDQRIAMRPATKAELQRSQPEAPVAPAGDAPAVPSDEVSIDGVNINAQISEDSPAQ